MFGIKFKTQHPHIDATYIAAVAIKDPGCAKVLQKMKEDEQKVLCQIKWWFAGLGVCDWKDFTAFFGMIGVLVFLVVFAVCGVCVSIDEGHASVACRPYQVVDANSGWFSNHIASCMTDKPGVTKQARY